MERFCCLPIAFLSLQDAVIHFFFPSLRGAAATWQSKEVINCTQFIINIINFISVVVNAAQRFAPLFRHCERPTGAWQSTTFTSLRETVIHFFFPSLRGAAATWQSKKNAANNGYERANFGVRNDNSLHKSLFFNAKVKNGLILDAVRHCERPTGAWQSTTFPSLQETVIHFFFPSLRGAIATWQSKEIFEKINRFISFITIKNLRFFDNIKRFALFHDTSCLAMTKEKLSPQTKRGGFFLRAEMPSQISEKTDCHNTSCLAMTEKKSDKVGKERCGEYDKKTATDFGETDKDELKVSSIREVCKPRVKTNSHSNKENR